MKVFKLFLLLAFYSLPAFSQNKNAVPSQSNSPKRSGYEFLRYPNSRVDSVNVQEKDSILSQLEGLYFISGTVFFSGANFRNVIQTSLQGKGMRAGDNFGNCISGSRVSFVDCVIKKDDGSRILIRKTLIFR